MTGKQIEQAKEAYLSAHREAKSRHAREAGAGASGYLPALEEILEEAPIYAERRVGVEAVPLGQIAGTVSLTRARTFAPEFLPLPPEESEFAMKWVRVYAQQLDTGITDPVELREYLNWYFVSEGNKRVSVLKRLGAYEIEANVTRLLPNKNTDDPEVATYYRFLSFKEKTGLKDIWIRDPDGYEKLLAHIDRSPYAEIEEKNRYYRFYHDTYLPFRKSLKKAGGDRLPLTTGEALNRYIEMAGFPRYFSQEELELRVGEVIKELALRSEEIGITTEPIKPAEHNLLTSIGQLVRPSKALRVAFVHYANPIVAEWTGAHEEARKSLQETLGERIETKAYWLQDPPSNFRKEIQEAAAEADVLFSTAGILYEATRKAAMKEPGVRFFAASREKSGVHVRTYSPRSHETHFLSGMIAGAMCSDRPIGFIISNYSAYSFALINSFALGAEGVNSRARIELAWNDRWFDDYFAPELLPDDIGEGDRLFFHNLIPPKESGYTGYGLYSYQDGSFTKYADLTYDWREFYRNVVENILIGHLRGFESEHSEHARLLTFWGGLKTGVIDLTLDPDIVPPGVRRVVEAVKTLMLVGDFSPFSGPISDREGRVRVRAEETLGYDEIISMDYLVEGVEGRYLDPYKLITR